MWAAGEDAEIDARTERGRALLVDATRGLVLHLLLLCLREERLALGVRHRAPLGGSEHALLRCLRLVAKDVRDKPRVRADALEEHEIGAEGLLGRVRVLDVALARLAGLALCRAEEVLALDVLGRERAHICFMLLLARLLHRLRAALVWLPRNVSIYAPEKGDTHLLLRSGETGVLLARLLGGLRDVELARARGLLVLDPVGEIELPRGRRELGRAQHGLERCERSQSQISAINRTMGTHDCPRAAAAAGRAPHRPRRASCCCGARWHRGRRGS